MSDIEEILNEFVKEKYTQERKDLSRVIYSKFQAKQQTIDKLTKEVDIQTKFKEAYLGHWQDSKDEVCKLTKEVEGLRAEWDLSEKAHSLSIEDRIKVVQENTKLKEENERLFKMDLEKLKDLAISEEMVKDLNQLATDRGNEVHKLKEQLKELEDGIVFGLDFNMQNNHKEYFKQLLTKQQ